MLGLKEGMVFMEYYPYSDLKQEERAYEIMLLRDQHNNTFADIAEEYTISVARAKQVYDRIKLKQIHLYINHIAFTLGHENDLLVSEAFYSAFECYWEMPYVCAYFEKKYKTILTEYRAGEPGLPSQFIKNMPPFKSKPSKKTVARVIEMREVEKASYIEIGKELKMTQAKAKHTYEWFYHQQAMVIIKSLQEKVESFEEKKAIWDSHFREYRTSKKRYDALMARVNDKTSPCPFEVPSNKENDG